MNLRLFHLPLLLAVASLVPAHAHDNDSQSGPLGKVSFPTSCDPKVQPAFERSVAMLHSFWYSAGDQAFRDVRVRRVELVQIRVRFPLLEAEFDLPPEAIESTHEVEGERRARTIAAQARHGR